MKLLNLIKTFFLSGVVLISCDQKKAAESKTLSFKIDSLIHATPDFSGVILVADKGKVIYHKAFGLRNVELQTPLDTTDVFELASVSKQFTAMIIMMLEEEGKLAFDDSVSLYIPDLPYKGITVRQLLNHTSGLPDYQSVMDQYWDKSKIAGNDDNIAYLIRYRPPALFNPGKKYEYSNTGYMLLATIAEKVSGEDFIDLCRNRIFIPLQLKGTDIRTSEEKKRIENFALGYIYVTEKGKYVRADSFPQFNYTIWLGNRKGPGRISSTSTDLLKWDRALYTDQLIKQSTLKDAFTPARLNSDSLSQYGFGWELSEDKKLGKVVSHTGDNPGYKTEIIRYLDADKTII
ncbi:MAG: serine hydrolase, partial [Marivirga sp.]|nr:serine hydrolase [Marivirga sp.]